MRYTECRLGSLALELMSGIDEETVDFVANYDATSEEPTVLPARFPNLLVNGSQGIAVGMATNIPPHNLGEVIDATIHLLEHPEATPDDLMAVRQGPGLPDRGADPRPPGHPRRHSHRAGARSRCGPWPRSRRAGTARPASWSPRCPTRRRSMVSKKIEDLVHAGDLDGIAEAQNDSSGGKTRLVIRLKRDANANVVLNNLFKQTPMQTTFSVNAVALVDGVPRTLNLAQMLTHYVAHQVEVVTRRSEFLLDKARARAHVVEGLLKAIDMLDAVIAAIRGSDDRPAALEALRADAVRLLRGAGQPHPRHDPGPAHPAGPDQPRRGDGQAPRGDRRARVDPGRPGQAAGRHRRRAGGDPGEVRQRAAHRHHPRSRAT